MLLRSFERLCHHRLMYLKTCSVAAGAVWGGLSVIGCWLWDFKNWDNTHFAFCFLLVRDVISASCSMNTFLQVALVMMLYHRDRKLTNAGSLCNSNSVPILLWYRSLKAHGIGSYKSVNKIALWKLELSSLTIHLILSLYLLLMVKSVGPQNPHHEKKSYYQP